MMKKNEFYGEMHYYWIFFINFALSILGKSNLTLFPFLSRMDETK
jgi:hypothetical protein